VVGCRVSEELAFSLFVIYPDTSLHVFTIQKITARIFIAVKISSLARDWGNVKYKVWKHMSGSRVGDKIL
jgi:hypothetical protein